MYINGFNRQKVMETIKKNNQGYQAYSSGECSYRTSENEPNACLVGCFIPDDKYSENMENRCAEVVVDEFKLNNFMPLETIFMQKLQCFHDEELDDVSGKDFFDAVEQKLVDLEKLNC